MQHEDDIEEGELSDDPVPDVIEPYTALERPSFAPIHRPPATKQFEIDDSSDSSSSSSDDSDSDEGFRPAKKRRKTNEDKLHFKSVAPAVKKNIWGSVIIEDNIERELKEFDVQHSKSFLDRSRDVETYDYTLALRSRLDEDLLDKETEKKIRKKLKELDKKDGGDSLMKTEEPEEPEDFESTLKQTQQLLNSRKRKMDQRDTHKPKKHSHKQKVVRVEDLSATAESTDLELAQDIASKLYEEKTDLILRTIEVLGKETAIDLFKETQEAENDGGILVADGSRRRTPGGVFLYLLRNHDTIPQEQIRLVFSEEHKAKEKHKREIRARRRQEQAEKLKKTLIENGDLPVLPSRAELELQKSAIKEEPVFKEEPFVKEEPAVVKQEHAAIKAEPTSGDNGMQTDDDRMAVAYGDDDTLVDINFECE